MKRKSEEKKLLCKSTTTPEKPLTTDKNYYFLPYAENKQCLYVYTLYEDTKRRLYHTNILERIVDDLVSRSKVGYIYTYIYIYIQVYSLR